MNSARWALATAAAVAMLLLATSGCGDSTSPSNPDVHGGPDNPAPDGSYTEAPGELMTIEATGYLLTTKLLIFEINWFEDQSDTTVQHMTAMALLNAPQ